MSVRIAAGGSAEEAVGRVVPRLVDERVASGITAQDPTLWGSDAEAAASRRLGWTEAVATSRPLVGEIAALRERLAADGVTRVVLCATGGASRGPEVIARTQGVALTVLDSAEPGELLSALRGPIADTVVVVSSKSGSTLETDGHLHAFEQAFTAAGIDPAGRIVVVTDAGSALDSAARAAGRRVFAADPSVGGRFSALTAFGLVPSGLAGADIAELLDEAESEVLNLAIDDPSNNGLILGAAIAGTNPRRDKLGIVMDGTHLVGFDEWVEQLIAGSTGKDGTGILPVVLDPGSPEVTAGMPDLQIVRLVHDAEAHDRRAHLRSGEVLISGTLGELLLVWEYAAAVAGRLLGVDPFDQPDVEGARRATAALLDAPTGVPDPRFAESGVEVRAEGDLLDGVSTLRGALDALLAQVPDRGYVAVQAFLDRTALPDPAALRERLAVRSGRPVTFGWGPRALHSTEQFHLGGPPIGVFLQITADPIEDLELPERPSTYGSLVRAQAQAGAAALGGRGRPVLRLHLTGDGAADALLAAVTA